MTEANPPAVVIDTTEFQPDLFLSKSSWLQARLWALKGQLQLWVPEASSERPSGTTGLNSIST